MKFHIGITMEDDGGVKVESANPAAVSPWTIIGLLEKIKMEIILATEIGEKIE